MSCTRCLSMAGVAYVTILATGALSWAGESTDESAAQQAAIRQAGAAYLEALSRGEAKALASHWSADGVYVDAAGNSFNAHKLIHKSFGPAGAATPTARALSDTNSKIRLITPNVAIEEGTFSADSGVDAGSFTAVWVKEDGVWRLDSLREHAAAANLRPNRLQALAWMIGDWVGQGEDFSVTCSAAWSENGKFIVRRFTVERSGREVLQGTQRIGWDPRARTIRSWGFDSAGGIVEGRWRQEGNSWIVKTTGALPNGGKSSGINFWVPEGDDRYVLKSSHVRVDEAPVEDSVVEFRRAHVGR